MHTAGSRRNAVAGRREARASELAHRTDGVVHDCLADRHLDFLLDRYGHKVVAYRTFHLHGSADTAAGMVTVDGVVVHNNIFKDGQLDECNLTLKDLHQIANSFTKILVGIFHQRIDYPTIETDKESAGEKDTYGNTDTKPPKEETIRALEDERRSKEDIKRLGIS